MKIPHKIFGIAMLVFLMMGSTILYSTYKLYLVSREATDLAEIFIPLSDQVGEIGIQVLLQETHVERHQKHLIEARLIEVKRDELIAAVPSSSNLVPSADNDDRIAELESDHAALIEEIATNEKAYDELETRLDASLKRAEADVESAIANAATINGQNTLSALLPMVQAIEQQQSSLNDQLRLLVQTLKEGRVQHPQLEDLIEAEQEKLASQLDATEDKLAHYMLGASGRAEEHERQALLVSVALTIASGLLALLASGLVIRTMLVPLRRLIAGTNEVENGNLTGELKALTKDEIGDLTRSFNGMVEGLRKSEQIKVKFGQYVDPRVVSALIEETGKELMSGERKVVSVFFADLANFTGISERFSPEGVVTLVNHYLAMMSEPVTQHQGLIDKYIGDAIMAFWTPPFCDDGQQATLAVRAALQDAALVRIFRQELPALTGLARDLPDIHMRIGIATGDAIVGSIGSEKSKNYTVIGDTVNLGSRLESANRIYGTTILVCRQTFEMASGAFEFRKIDDLLVFGKTEPVSVYEPLGAVSALDRDLLAYRDQFEDALAMFHKGAWTDAQNAFQACKQTRENDSACDTYLKRLTMIKQDGPPPEWNGVWHMDSK
tara:strand:+ start:63523 stop:65352 length:1830 start_codon:yes stop_codon:yes gene_type:complete